MLRVKCILHVFLLLLPFVVNKDYQMFGVIDETAQVTRAIKKELCMMKDLTHDNVNRFVGACLDPPHVCIVSNYCSRGSLKVKQYFLYITHWYHVSYDYFAPREGVRDIVLGISVCQSHGWSSLNFLCILPVAMARFFSDGVAIRYLLPVLWLTSCFQIIAQYVASCVFQSKQR